MIGLFCPIHLHLGLFDSRQHCPRKTVLVVAGRAIMPRLTAKVKIGH